MTALDEDLIQLLAATRTIDLTTTGRRSGNPSRIEIWWFHVEGRFIISGTPGRRDWMANVIADPRVMIHAPAGDFDGTATIIDDQAFRRRFFTDANVNWYRTQADLDLLVETAPMIEISLH